MYKQENESVLVEVPGADQRTKDKISHAVERMMTYFGHEVGFSSILQEQAEAMTEVLSVMFAVLTRVNDYSYRIPETVALYFGTMGDLLKMLQPIAEAAEELQLEERITKKLNDL